jgi:hypothetical protein
LPIADFDLSLVTSVATPKKGWKIAEIKLPAHFVRAVGELKFPTIQNRPRR